MDTENSIIYESGQTALHTAGQRHPVIQLGLIVQVDNDCDKIPRAASRNASVQMAAQTILSKVKQLVFAWPQPCRCMQAVTL